MDAVLLQTIYRCEPTATRIGRLTFHHHAIIIIVYHMRKSDNRHSSFVGGLLVSLLIAALLGCSEGEVHQTIKAAGDNNQDPVAGPNEAILTWDANTETDLAGYNVYFGTASGQYGTPEDAGNVTTYTLQNLTSGTRYFFAVSAYDLAGNESTLSDEVFKDIP
jgi:hypothetical protein